MSVGLVLVSHSRSLADGLLEVARQMAADVPIIPVGGTDDGRIGTSFDGVEQAIIELLASGVDGVVVLTDLGSATLTAESVLEMVDDERVILVDAPFVEGTVAAAVAAAGAADLSQVAAAARTAYASPGGEATPSSGAAPDDHAVTRSATLRNRLGLHARPAAAVARLAEGFDAAVTVNGADAGSVLEVMSLGLVAGDTVEITAAGPQAREAVEAIVTAIDEGFGET